MIEIHWLLSSDQDVAGYDETGRYHCVYWDEQDPNNTGYAYRTSIDGLAESGEIEASTLNEAITEYEKQIQESN